MAALSRATYTAFFSAFRRSCWFLFCLRLAIFSGKKSCKRDAITVLYIVIFAFIFYLGSAVNAVVTTVRYQIMVYPLSLWWRLSGWIKFLKSKRSRNIFRRLAHMPWSIIVLLGSLFIVRPNFLAYASELLPKSFIVNLKGMGEGSFEAASFLNSLPGAHEAVIWSDKGAVCEVYAGKCFIDFKKKTFLENKIEYIVVSTDRRSRSLKMSRSIKSTADFEKIYASDNFVFEVIIDNNPNDFVKVFKASDFLNQ